MPENEREMLGKKGREHLEKNYNLGTLMNKWDELFTQIHEKHGSWSTRKGYNRWTFKEIA